MQSDSRTSPPQSTSNHNRTRSSSAVSNWKKQKYKQYQPRFLHETSDSQISLPSAECFKLDYILKNVLHDESEQVINDLLNVSANYQKDLRQEIKHKLATEQRIQFKNINICRETNNINSIVHQRRKKLKKALTSSSFGNVDDSNAYDEGEVNHLLRKSIDISDRIKSTISKLHDLEEKHRPGRESLVSIKREKYPNLYKLLSKKTESSKSQGSADTEIIEENLNENDADSKNEIVPNEEAQIEEEIDDSNLETESPFIDEAEGTRHEKLESTTSKPALPQDDIMDPTEFELFMSNSIVKYREQQNKSLKTIKTDDQSLVLSQISHKSGGNPLNLLYSQLISNPKYLDQHQREQNASKYPFSSILSLKSSATIKSTQQSSHYKKLRINGSPLTSEHFQRERERLQQRSEQSGAALTAKMLEELALDHEDGTVNDENEDVWNSSGMNTEDDDEGIEVDKSDADLHLEPHLESDVSNETSSLSSSDLDTSDSDSSTDLHLQLANNYYTNLQHGVKPKRRDHKVRKATNRRKTRLQVKEMSPTPKHKPSHHILKPKSSILKTKTTSPVRQRSNLRKENANIVNDAYDHEISALSEVNNAYGSKTDNCISSFNASGTIILKHDKHKHNHHDEHDQVENDVVSKGEGSPRSISILKSFVQ
ncbi:hypothetical protein FOB58_004270 [Candida parapsilosis]|uniref:Uncharacterized protein n=2 Tax=Candida parapsilosis TaxID=5480 RepID=G8BJI0_CANPC|nr:uncharacterized protein CPAR2_405990 [Candida parapsilosis]KAF6045833.1 hypothetical protein FOB58_004270 [Candida parapsilosis]KAF6046614.1 hypothetical protein FOB59_004079 [Candida parapsilosis]KAF6050945.1 hypothetical protein FOB60_003613 [Candida parapsilosis]KAF6062333.1 hypothetical protein FOB61_003763 [Candida parapsilosis]KAI5903285.1 hypothetical protein K4G60_g2440 [Candida parapsilosis]